MHCGAARPAGPEACPEACPALRCELTFRIAFQIVFRCLLQLLHPSPGYITFPLPSSQDEVPLVSECSAQGSLPREHLQSGIGASGRPRTAPLGLTTPTALLLCHCCPFSASGHPLAPGSQAAPAPWLALHVAARGISTPCEWLGLGQRGNSAAHVLETVKFPHSATWFSFPFLKQKQG